MDIVLLATAWGSSGGGLSTLNTSLATSLAAAVEAARVACVVNRATSAEIAGAGASGVLLLSLDQTDGDVLDGRHAEAVKSLLVARSIGPSWLVGHDIKTGWAAVEVARLMAGSRALVLHHMSYRDYGDLKTPGGISDDSKAQEQAKLFKVAERVAAVGPLLHDRLKDFARSDGYLLVPGLDDLQVSETQPNQTLRCVVTGRLDASHDALKQTSLVVHAFAEAVRRAESGRSGADRIASLDVVGVSENDGAVEELRREAEDIADRHVNIQFFPFSSDRALVLSRVRNSNLFMFLSTHDGFGLSAWEAIGLGIPVLLSKNTGVHRLLSSLGPSVRSLFRSVDIRGSTAGSGHSYRIEDRDAVASVILDATQAIPVNLECASNLRNLLLTQRGYSWGLVTEALCKSLGVASRPPRIQAPSVRVLRATCTPRFKVGPPDTPKLLPTPYGSVVLRPNGTVDVSPVLEEMPRESDPTPVKYMGWRMLALATLRTSTSLFARASTSLYSTASWPMVRGKAHPSRPEATAPSDRSTTSMLRVTRSRAMAGST
ncbi:MAG: glycosyltransferase [Candidatus Sericytochromatia bacterium]|nr:glycosyltransferase [Candidatus Sericytochromatia bacterium]